MGRRANQVETRRRATAKGDTRAKVHAAGLSASTVGLTNSHELTFSSMATAMVEPLRAGPFFVCLGTAQSDSGAYPRGPPSNRLIADGQPLPLPSGPSGHGATSLVLSQFSMAEMGAGSDSYV